MGLTREQRKLEKLAAVTQAQKEIYLVIEEYWNRFGFGPSVDDVLLITGEK